MDKHRREVYSAHVTTKILEVSLREVTFLVFSRISLLTAMVSSWKAIRLDPGIPLGNQTSITVLVKTSPFSLVIANLKEAVAGKTHVNPYNTLKSLIDR
jgi:hypothetical protein